MPKLIPTIYFYLVSLIGFVLLIIGVFSSIHYVVNITSYPEYPLGYSAPDRCAPMQVAPMEKVGTTSAYSQKQCLDDIEKERQIQKTGDLEKALSFTIIGLLVFGTHFFYAREKLS